MFVILVYDAQDNRVAKLMKTCRKYLRHVQKSVFEGTLTDAKLKQLKLEIQKIIDCEQDAVHIYETNWPQHLVKEQIGVAEECSNII